MHQPSVEFAAFSNANRRLRRILEPILKEVFCFQDCKNDDDERKQHHNGGSLADHRRQRVGIERLLDEMRIHKGLAMVLVLGILVLMLVNHSIEQHEWNSFTERTCRGHGAARRCTPDFVIIGAGVMPLTPDDASDHRSYTRNAVYRKERDVVALLLPRGSSRRGATVQEAGHVL